MRWTSTVAAILVLCVSAVASAQTERPNVVLIMSDDLGYRDLSSYGATDLSTPHIDSIGRDGIRLTDFYANGVLCSPTRAGLITGRYQQRYAVESAIGASARLRDGSISEMGLVVTGASLPQLLKDTGYATAHVGKWHLGYRSEFSANAHGFDYFFGFKAGLIDHYVHTDGAGDPDLWENETPIQEEGYMTDLITERSVRFIEENADQPFFVDVAYNAPHWPYQPPDMPSVARDNARHLQPHNEDTSTRADYVAMVERVDQGVGEILDTLERLGLSDDTIVIFTNDNGGEWLSDNDPLFSRKWTVWEGGIRVPALIRWPGRIPAGRVSDQVGITMDLSASILAVAGVQVPANYEGMNLFPIWEGQAPEVERTLFWRTTAGNRSQRAIRQGDWKVMVDANHVMVFNLRTDMAERNDLASQRQDIAQRLRPMLADWEEEVTAEARRNVPQFAPPARGRGAGGGQ